MDGSPPGGGFRPVSSQELTEWAAYEHVAGPLGGERDDILAGQVVAMIANVNRKKGTRAYQPGDMTLQWDRRGRRQSPQQQLDVLKAFTEAWRG